MCPPFQCRKKTGHISCSCLHAPLGSCMVIHYLCFCAVFFFFQKIMPSPASTAASPNPANTRGFMLSPVCASSGSAGLFVTTKVYSITFVFPSLNAAIGSSPLSALHSPMVLLCSAYPSMQAFFSASCLLYKPCKISTSTYLPPPFNAGA